MKNLIKLDVDGVLLDILSPWLAHYNELTGDNLRYGQIDRWNWEQLALPEYREIIPAMRLPHFYDNAQPFVGAQRVVRELAAAGYTLVALTHDYRSHLKRKVRRLRALYPELRHIVFAERKWNVIPQGILIDDGIHNEPTITFSQPWNAKTKMPHRASNWEGVEYLVSQLLPLQEATDATR